MFDESSYDEQTEVEMGLLSWVVVGCMIVFSFAMYLVGRPE